LIPVGNLNVKVKGAMAV